MRWPIVLAIVGIAVGIVAEVAPLYMPETPAWVWGVLFWSAIIVIISAVSWGIWPKISPSAPIIQISWPQGRRLWSRLIDRIRKTKLKSNFPAEQIAASSPNIVTFYVYIPAQQEFVEDSVTQVNYYKTKTTCQPSNFRVELDISGTSVKVYRSNKHDKSWNTDQRVQVTIEEWP